MAIAPMDAAGSESVSGVQVTPPFADFPRRPAAAPADTMSGGALPPAHPRRADAPGFHALEEGRIELRRGGCRDQGGEGGREQQSGGARHASSGRSTGYLGDL